MDRINTLDRPKLPPLFKRQLDAIEPTKAESAKYFPCDVVLKTGERVDCVYFISLKDYVQLFRSYPDRGRAKGVLDIDEIASVAESRFRLPAKFASTIRESGMGYCIFTVVFASGLRQVYLTGDCLAFVTYPDGLGKDDVVDVWPDTGRGEAYLEGRKFSWCVFSE